MDKDEDHSISEGKRPESGSVEPAGRIGSSTWSDDRQLVQSRSDQVLEIGRVVLIDPAGERYPK